MTPMKNLTDCINHFSGYSVITIQDYNVIAKYIEDHKYFLSQEKGKEISWDESYNNFREYVYGPIVNAIWRYKLGKLLNKETIHMFVYYIRIAQTVALRHSMDVWFTPDPDLICNYILWKFYFEKSSLSQKPLDKIVCWWYSKKVKSLRRDGGI